MTKNKGYTLVEMMMVIAIMAILTGTSFITLGIIKNAKRSSAVDTLNNQMSSCLIRTKAVSDTSSPLCMAIVKRNDSSYAIVTGFYNGTDIVDENGNSIDINTDAECEAVLPDVITEVRYTPANTEQGQESTADKMMIQFVKSDGSVALGAGRYEIYTAGNRLYETIYLDEVSGNHYRE